MIWKKCRKYQVTSWRISKESYRLFNPLILRGVGARDLQECLLIQLDHYEQHTPILDKMIRFHLDDIANGNLSKIAASTGITVQEVQKEEI